MGYEDMDFWDGVYTTKAENAQAKVEVDQEITDEELAYYDRMEEEKWAVWDAMAQGE